MDAVRQEDLSLRNRLVHFKICDVYFPHPKDVSIALHADDILQGKVIDLSDSGNQELAYAVIEIEGLNQPVIVAVERILGAL